MGNAKSKRHDMVLVLCECDVCVMCCGGVCGVSWRVVGARFGGGRRVVLCYTSRSCNVEWCVREKCHYSVFSYWGCDASLHAQN